MRGDWYRGEADSYLAESKKLGLTASSKEEWHAVSQLLAASRSLWDVGGSLDIHDEKYAKEPK